MNIFKVPSPNELKLSASDYQNILYQDRDPLILCEVCCDSDNEDDFSLRNITTDFSSQRDKVEVAASINELSRCTVGREPTVTRTDQVKCEEKKAGDAKAETLIRYTKICDNAEVDVTYLTAKVDDPITLKWLESNFECHQDYSIPRGEMFQLFTQYCLEHGIRMMCNQATFGKSVRAIFPSLKTRRIGIRGKSRYHYDGIRPKMNSQVSDKLIPRKNGSLRLQVDWRECKNDLNQEHQPEIRQEIDFGPNYPSDHLITILMPKFPSMRTVCVDNEIRELVSMFLMLYRCYTVDILKTVIKTKFAQLEHITSTFWKNIPGEIGSILTHQDTLNVIRTCDAMIYSCLTKLLIPSILIPIPTGMIRLIENTFGPAYIGWYITALSSCPTVLQEQSVLEAVRFSKKLSEKLQLCDLCSKARGTLQCSETTKSIRNMIKRLDPKTIMDIARFPLQVYRDEMLYMRIENGIYEFQQLLAERANFDKYIAWLKSTVLHAINTANKKGGNLKGLARVVILELSYITGVIAREINMEASESVQRAFHDVEAFFISYVKYLLETEHFN